MTHFGFCFIERNDLKTQELMTPILLQHISVRRAVLERFQKFVRSVRVPENPPDDSCGGLTKSDEPVIAAGVRCTKED